MADEPVTLRLRDGRTVDAVAQVRRYGAGRRTGTAAAILTVAFTVGPATVVVPGVHFVAPWLVPLLGVGIAGYLYRRVAVVDGARGTCVACNREMDIHDGGALGNDPLWLRCPHCGTPMELVAAEA